MTTTEAPPLDDRRSTSNEETIQSREESTDRVGETGEGRRRNGERDRVRDWLFLETRLSSPQRAASELELPRTNVESADADTDANADATSLQDEPLMHHDPGFYRLLTISDLSYMTSLPFLYSVSGHELAIFF